MNRRGFLKWFSLGTATAAGVATGLVDPEQLLWVPGQKTHILPPRGGWQNLGISTRLVCNYGTFTDAWPCRMDMLYGWSMPIPMTGLNVAAPQFDQAIQAAAKSLADKIDADALRLYDYWVSTEIPPSPRDGYALI